jgi:hypothetical protein
LSSLSQLAELPVWSLLLLLGVPFVATLLFVPWAVVRIPSDYFRHGHRRPVPWSSYHPVLRLLLLLGKNLLALVLLLMGVAMLLLPGQGLLTMLVGLLLLDFPGKFNCERWLVSRGPVLKAINWLRRKRQRPPLVVD